MGRAGYAGSQHSASPTRHRSTWVKRSRSLKRPCSPTSKSRPSASSCRWIGFGPQCAEVCRRPGLGQAMARSQCMPPFRWQGEPLTTDSVSLITVASSTVELRRSGPNSLQGCWSSRPARPSLRRAIARTGFDESNSIEGHCSHLHLFLDCRVKLIYHCKPLATISTYAISSAESAVADCSALVLQFSLQGRI